MTAARFSLDELVHPIVQAPMAGGPSTLALAAAVGEAGGLGFLAGALRTPRQLGEDIDALRAAGGAPFGVNLFCPPAPVAPAAELERYATALGEDAARLGVEVGEPRHHDDGWEGKLAVVRERRPAIVSFTFGCPPAATFAELQAAGIAVWVTITTPEEARTAALAGADALVVQGVEAGGHRGTFDDAAPGDIGLLALLQLVGEAVRTAGGAPAELPAGRLPPQAAGGAPTGTRALPTGRPPQGAGGAPAGAGALPTGRAPQAAGGAPTGAGALPTGRPPQGAGGAPAAAGALPPGRLTLQAAGGALPAELPAARLPLVAAGGLMTGAGIAAALVAGASAAQLGSAFMLTPEAGTTEPHRAALAAPGTTTLTRAFSGRTARGIANRFLRAHDSHAPRAYPDVQHMTTPLRAAALAAGDADGLNLWAGQAHELAQPVPAGELVSRLAAEARATLRAAAERAGG